MVISRAYIYSDFIESCKKNLGRREPLAEYVHCLVSYGVMARRFSCEPNRKSTLQCWRMVLQRRVQGLKLAKIAENLSVDTSTFQRIASKFDATGQVCKKSYSAQNIVRKPVQLTIMQLVLAKPLIWMSLDQVYASFQLF